MGRIIRKETRMSRNAVHPWNVGQLALLRLVLPVVVAGLCASCGLAGTAVATGTGAAAEAQQAQQAKETEDRVKRELDQAQQAAAQTRSDAESQGK
jgi:hypothetical protein